MRLDTVSHAFTRLLDAPCVRRRIQRKVRAIRQIDPDRIRPEDVCNVFGFPPIIARCVLNLAVHEGALERLPNDDRGERFRLVTQ